MTETIRHTVEAVSGFVFENSLPASLVIIIVLALQLSFGTRFSPRWRHALWYIVLIRLAAPWVPETTLSPFNLTQNPLVYYDEPAALRTDDAVVATAPINENSDAAFSHTPLPGSLSPVTIVWCLGLFLYCAGIFVSLIRIKRLERRAQPIDDESIYRLLGDCKSRLHVRQNIPILVSDSNAITAVTGLLRPKIILPRSKLTSLRPEELEHVLMHELAHVKRMDIPLAWIGAVLQSLYWFHPLVWYGMYRMRVDREDACDALVVSRLGSHSVSDYGQTLLKLSQGASPLRFLPHVVGIQEHRSRIKRRIQMVLQLNEKSYRYSVLGIVVMGIAGMALLTNAAPEDGSVPYRFAHRMEIEMYQQSWSTFQAGDDITVTAVWGTTPHFEVGGEYLVRGRYTLGSRDEAKLHAYATNGEVSSKQGPDVTRGSGEYERIFTMKKLGMPHINYYPAGGGSGIGGVYFREPALKSSDPDASYDIAIDDALLVLQLSENKTQIRIEIRIINRGKTIIEAPEVEIYRGVPKKLIPMVKRSHPLYPNEVWNRSSHFLDVGEDPQIFYAVLDPNDTLSETDETNNTIQLTLDAGKVSLSRPEID